MEKLIEMYFFCRDEKIDEVMKNCYLDENGKTLYCNLRRSLKIKNLSSMSIGNQD